LSANIPSPTHRGPKNHLFSTTLQLSVNFNSLYLLNETCYRQSGNYKGSATSSQNDMNFGSQTASNWKWVFTHPP